MVIDFTVIIPRGFTKFKNSSIPFLHNYFPF